MASFQERLFERLYGHSVSEEAPYYNPLMDAASDFISKVYLKADHFAKEVKNLARKNEIPESYMWWLMYDNRDTWPPMVPQQKEAFEIALHITSTTGEVPNYGIAFRRPPEEKENLADLLVFDLAAWSWRTMMREIHRDLFASTKKYAPRISKVYPQLDHTKAAGLLIQLMMHYATHYPTTFKDSFVMRKIFSLLKLT